MVHRAEGRVRAEPFSDHGFDVARLNGIRHGSAVLVDCDLAPRELTYA
ncbi:hypothetical protein [Microbacterium sp. PMB16]